MSRPPAEHQAWYWGRARLFIIAHQGWAAAVRDARTSDMERLGIQLLPEVARPTSPPHRGIAGPAGWCRRPSRPSGLRAPPRGASAAPAPKRKDYVGTAGGAGDDDSVSPLWPPCHLLYPWSRSLPGAVPRRPRSKSTKLRDSSAQDCTCLVSVLLRR